MRTDDHGDLLVGGTNRSGADLGGGPGRGGFIAKLTADAALVKWIFYAEGIDDFAAAGNGDLLVVRSGILSRFDSATGAERWRAAISGPGSDHPVAVGYDARSDVTVIAGSRAVATGDESFLLPYAAAYDAGGRLRWTLWDADPHLLRSGSGGFHLTADGMATRMVASDGAIYLAQISTGGNTVLSHDAHDPSQMTQVDIRAGVHQDTPGFGFSGAVPVSSLSRLDPAHGSLAKQTWISAWTDPAHASAWAVTDIGGDAGVIAAVGESAAGGPSRGSWSAAHQSVPSPGAQAGGSIALFDQDMRLLQSGSFPQVHWTCTAMRGDLLVVAGHLEADATPAIFHPLPATGGGRSNGYIAVFACDSQTPKGRTP
jgi:hypothetical protein